MGATHDLRRALLAALFAASLGAIAARASRRATEPSRATLAHAALAIGALLGAWGLGAGAASVAAGVAATGVARTFWEAT